MPARLLQWANRWDTKSTSDKTDDDIVEEVTYTYNLQNRLARLEKYDDTHTLIDVVEYKYNTDGIRVAKIKDPDGTPVTTNYLVDPYNHTGYAQVIEEKDGLGTVTKSYTIGDDVISQTTTTAGTQYLLYDGLGSTRQLADNTGVLVAGQSYSYDAYGVMLASTTNPNPADNAATSLLYAGEQYDSALGQYYLRARYYNPYNGSFNRMDPYSGSPSDPQSLHKYLYCHANPINGIDPGGEFAITISFALTIFAIVLLMPSSTGSKWDKIYNKFIRWYRKEQARGPWWKKLPKCPGPLRIVDGKAKKPIDISGDSWYSGYWYDPEEPSEFEGRVHPGAKFSMRSIIIDSSSNQCIYNQQGKLVIERTTAGTVDLVAPKLNLISHYYVDVRPMLWANYLDHGVMRSIWYGEPIEKKAGEYMTLYYNVRPSW